ncbi:MAG: histidine kinase [Bacteroidota bacterium]
MTSTTWLEKRSFGIRHSEYLVVLIGYLMAAFLYHLALEISALSFSEKPFSLLALFDFYDFVDGAGLNYLIKLVLTVPFWWFFFRVLRHWKLSHRITLHLIGMPVYVTLFAALHKVISTQLDLFYLQGYAMAWDIYIPALFYGVQFGIFHAYEYYQQNQRDLKLKAELKEAALNSELSALKAQLNPHFLYNVFNTISASVPPEQERTREMIAQLSDLFRYQLKASKSELVSLQEELDFVQKYLDLEKARFEDRLRVTIDVPLAIRDAQVPPMILQPLVENSIKHGIASLIEGGEVAIRVRRMGEKIQFEVSDTGIGVTDKTKLFDVGIGLTNTKLRLEKQYGSELKISDNVPRGLKIEFAL